MICIPIFAKDTQGALEKMTQAAGLADLLELRLDLMEAFRLEALVREAPCPVIATYRSLKEGGKGRAGYSERVRILTRAAAAGARWIDVEYSMPLEFQRQIQERRAKARIMVSCHVRNGTPSKEDLEDRLRRMAAGGADLVKIVTLAREPGDNLRALNLIPLAEKLGVGLVAFCMGPLGRPSRILSPLLGAAFTFASLNEEEETAAGQLSAEDTRWILDRLGSP